MIFIVVGYGHHIALRGSNTVKNSTIVRGVSSYKQIQSSDPLFNISTYCCGFQKRIDHAIRVEVFKVPGSIFTYYLID